MLPRIDLQKMCFMKQHFSSLFIILLLVSCSPKFTEYNDHGFGGGFGNRRVSKIEKNNLEEVLINQTSKSVELIQSEDFSIAGEGSKSLQFQKQNKVKGIKRLTSLIHKGKLMNKLSLPTTKFALNKKSKKAFDFLPYSDKPLFVQILIALGWLCIFGFVGVLLYNLFIVAKYFDIGLVLLGLGIVLILFGNWIDYMIEEEIGGKFFVVCLQVLLILIAVLIMFLMLPGALMM